MKPRNVFLVALLGMLLAQFFSTISTYNGILFVKTRFLVFGFPFGFYETSSIASSFYLAILLIDLCFIFGLSLLLSFAFAYREQRDRLRYKILKISATTLLSILLMYLLVFSQAGYYPPAFMQASAFFGLLVVLPILLFKYFPNKFFRASVVLFLLFMAVSAVLSLLIIKKSGVIIVSTVYEDTYTRYARGFLQNKDLSKECQAPNYKDAEDLSAELDAYDICLRKLFNERASFVHRTYAKFVSALAELFELPLVMTVFWKRIIGL